MAVRTTSADVVDILGDLYGPNRAGALPSLTGAIATASAIVDRVITCATRKGITISTSEAELMERWLAGHVYLRRDLPAQSASNLGASMSFQGQTGMHLEATYHGQTALSLDPSRCLAAISKGAVTDGGWLGLAPEDQLTAKERGW